MEPVKIEKLNEVNQKIDFSELFNKRTGSIKPGLDRMQACLPYLDDSPMHPTILIGGTNGKGGTSGFLWHSLASAQIKSGLFTSPHLINFSERFVTSSEVQDSTIARSWEKIKTTIPEHLYEQLSFFELSTLIGVDIFTRTNCKVHIFEVGLGGRLDSTNALDPAVSVITSIGMDHQEYLGNTIEKITKEKLGIIRSNRPLFIGKIDYPEATKIIKNEARKHQAPLIELGKHILLKNDRIHLKIPNVPHIIAPIPKNLNAAPEYVKNNFALAIAIHHWLREHQMVDGSGPDKIEFFKAPLPPCLSARFQTMQVPYKGRTIEVILDVCHNPDGVRNFTNNLQKHYKAITRSKLPGLVCILNDKEMNPMLDNLKGFLNPIVLFKISSDRCFTSDGVSQRHSDIQVTPSFEMGLERIFDEGRQTGPFVICGSVLAMGKVLEYFSQTPQQMAQSLQRFGYSP